MSTSERIIREGWQVYTADGEAIGEVREHHRDYLHVHHGRLFGTDSYYFPSWAVGRVDENANRVYLTLNMSELEDQDWSTMPQPGETRAMRSSGAASRTTAMAQQTMDTGEVLDQRELVVPVVEERLDVTKRPVELGEVIINRTVTEQDQTVPVDVAHEEVRVERRPASREASAEDLRLAAGEGLARLEAGGTVIMPIIEEVVEVRKRMMVREELVITKQRVTERHDVTERVRRVEPRIESVGRLERDIEDAGPATSNRSDRAR